MTGAWLKGAALAVVEALLQALALPLPEMLTVGRAESEGKGEKLALVAAEGLLLREPELELEPLGLLLSVAELLTEGEPLLDGTETLGAALLLRSALEEPERVGVLQLLAVRARESVCEGEVLKLGLPVPLLRGVTELDTEPERLAELEAESAGEEE